MAWVALVMELPPIAELRHLPVYLFLGAVAGVCAAILVLAGFAHQVYNKSMTKVEILEIFDSPEPTRHHYSPTGSVYRRPSTAKRAGKRRVVSHKRTYTMRYSPKRADHCAYEAIAWMTCATSRPTMRHVRLLREQTAILFEKGYVANEKVADVPVRSLTTQTGQTLAAYVADIKERQWASKVELHYAAVAQGVTVKLLEGEKKYVLGEGPYIGTIANRCQHYVVVKHAKPNGSKKYEFMNTLPSSQQVPRGGMPQRVDTRAAFADERLRMPLPVIVEEQNETLSDETTDDDCYIHLDMSMMRHRIQDIIIKREQQESVETLKNYIADLLEQDEDDFHILRNGELVPEWTSLLPGSYQVEPRLRGTQDDDYPRMGWRVKVHHVAAGTDHYFHVPLHATRTMFTQMVAYRLEVPVYLLSIVDDHGASWHFPEGLALTDSVLALAPIMRAGMHRQNQRSRSPTTLMVSPTLPIPENANDDDHVQERSDFWEEEEPSSDSQDERTTVAPTPQRAHPISVTLDSPPAAQPRTCPKAVYDRYGYVGRIRAPSRAMPADVLYQTYMQLHLVRPPLCSPRNARQWAELDHVEFPERQMPNLQTFVEMRENKWEYYQPLRVIPVMDYGMVTDHLVFPKHLSLLQCQGRVNAWAPWRHIITLSAMSESDWVGRTIYLSATIVDIVERSPEYVNGGDEAIERAGALSVNEVSDICGDASILQKGACADEKIMRGGGKKGNPLQPKQAMQYWAKDRALRECPDFNPNTIGDATQS